MKNRFVFLLILLGVHAWARDSVPPPFVPVCTWPNAPHFAHTSTFGATAGVTQGLGFSYRHWFTTEGLQVTMLPFVSLENDYQHITLSIAPSWLHALWESPLYDFLQRPTRNLVYSYFGLHYFMNRVKDERDEFWTPENSLAQSLFLGGGLGLQTNVSAIQLSLGVGFAAMLHDTRNWDERGVIPKEQVLALFPSLDATLGYAFGW